MRWNTSSKGNNPLKIGVTGGIGSGKSVVCRVFAQLGIPVFMADQEAKRLMDHQPETIIQLKAWFGDDIYLSNEVLDRKKLARIIFNDKIALEKVNALIHPAVRKAFSDWSKQQNAPYVIQEAAIIFENGQESSFDRVILVTAPYEDRIVRVMNRDGIDRDKVIERIRNQWPDEKKVGKAHEVIICDDQHLVIPQVIRIHEKFMLIWQSLENG